MLNFIGSQDTDQMVHPEYSEVKTIEDLWDKFQLYGMDTSQWSMDLGLSKIH